MITKEQLKEVCFNARIAFSEEEIQAFMQKINETIAMISVIEEIDLTDLEPMFYLSEHSVDFRDPALVMVTEQDKLLANTAKSDAGYFEIPVVLKDGEA